MQASTPNKIGSLNKRGAASKSRSFVTLGIGSEVFAVEVEFVREILGIREISLLPKAPDFVAGVIDVRGKTVPVVNLRLKLGLQAAEATEMTRILVLELDLEKGPVSVGLLADQVFEVAEIEEAEVEETPDVGVAWNSDYIRGISRLHGGFVILFNIKKLFGNSELTSMSALA
jgi:purine-binding chemotaxis protein CheW